MTKNNSAAAETAETAPPNCHVAIVPTSNCAVGADGANERVIHGIFPTFSLFLSAYFPATFLYIHKHKNLLTKTHPSDIYVL